MIETDGTELERNVDVNHMSLRIDTGLIYAMEYNLETGKIYFSDRNTSTLWTASLDNEIRAADDREVALSLSLFIYIALIAYILFSLSPMKAYMLGLLHMIGFLIVYTGVMIGMLLVINIL